MIEGPNQTKALEFKLKIWYNLEFKKPFGEYSIISDSYFAGTPFQEKKQLPELLYDLYI